MYLNLYWTLYSVALAIVDLKITGAHNNGVHNMQMQWQISRYVLLVYVFIR